MMDKDAWYSLHVCVWILIGCGLFIFLFIIGCTTLMPDMQSPGPPPSPPPMPNTSPDTIATPPLDSATNPKQASKIIIITPRIVQPIPINGVKVIFGTSFYPGTNYFYFLQQSPDKTNWTTIATFPTDGHKDVFTNTNFSGAPMFYRAGLSGPY